jgi:T5SS/PEP-CTERM-associated repeat protein
MKKLLFIFFTLTLNGGAFAQTSWEPPGPGDDWNDGGLWSAGTPDAATEAIIESGYVNLQGDGAAAALKLGGEEPDESAELYIGNGTLSVGGLVSVGNGSNFSIISLTDSGELEAGELIVGDLGSGSLEVTGASVTADSAIFAKAAGTDTMAGNFMEGSTFTVSGLLTVGEAGKGFLGFHTASQLNSGSMQLAVQENSEGTLEIREGSDWQNTGNVTLGQAGSALLTIIHSSQHGPYRRRCHGGSRGWKPGDN